MSKSLVKLTHQSFKDAGGLEVFPDLEMSDIVQVVTNNEVNSFEYLMERAYDKLKEIAEKENCTHIFGVECFPYQHPHNPPHYGPNYRLIGTAYKPKKDKLS